MSDARNALIGAFENVLEDAKDCSLKDLSAAILAYRRAYPTQLDRSPLLRELLDIPFAELGYREEMGVQATIDLSQGKSYLAD